MGAGVCAADKMIDFWQTDPKGGEAVSVAA